MLKKREPNLVYERYYGGKGVYADRLSIVYS